MTAILLKVDRSIPLSWERDLDLYVFNSAGAFVTFSSSWDSSGEAIDFAVTAGQTYTIKLGRISSVVPQTYVGLAWYNYVLGTE